VIRRWPIETLATQRQKILKIVLFWSLFVLLVLIGRKVWERPDMTVFIAGNLAFFFISIFATGLLTRLLAFRWLVAALCMIWMLMLGFAVR
jgi:hypothetical protein